MVSTRLVGRRGLHVVAAGIVSILGPSHAAAQKPDDTHALYDQGRAAMDQKDWQRAYDALNRVWKAWTTGEVAGNLGQTERMLGKCSAAIEHLRFALKDPKPGSPPEALTRVREWIQDCEQRVAKFSIDGVRDGSEVFVDGAYLGQAPLSGAILLDPGEHTIEARQSGTVVGTLTVVAKAGESQRVQLHEVVIAQKPAPAASASGTMAPPPAPPQSRSLMPVYIGAGLTVVGVVAGAAFMRAAASDQDDADALRTKLGPSGCLDGSGSVSDCRQILALAQAHDNKRVWMTASFIAAGSFAALTAGYYVWQRTSEPRPHGIRASVGFDRDGAAAYVEGRF